MEALIGHILSNMMSPSAPRPSRSLPRKGRLDERRAIQDDFFNINMDLPIPYLFPLRASSRNPLNPLRTTLPSTCISPVL